MEAVICDINVLIPLVYFNRQKCTSIVMHSRSTLAEIWMFLNETLAVSGIQCLTKHHCMQRPMYMYINGREVKFKVNKNISTSYSGYNRY